MSIYVQFVGTFTDQQHFDYCTEVEWIVWDNAKDNSVFCHYFYVPITVKYCKIEFLAQFDL